MAHVGTRVRKLRQQRKMSQQELARLVGVNQSFISKMENGERGDAQTARPYARLYNGLLSRDVRGRGYGDFDRRRSVGYGPGYGGRYL